ncbi:hypothetical protein [Nocardia sp. XZ_19_385]|uniref:hypothetical protein n=1 Tax=Nocardia sp. XZ_19_385 TaxID=2769488 RepID=UPI00188FAC65|nr:hypothetical protein [Nocardia sp. XZ_19_385]
MTDLVTKAQLVLLARTLHVPVERLAHLERLGAEALHELQQRMAAVIFAQHAATFERISKLVPIIPLSISIPLVQKLVPPMMTGRAAGAVGVKYPKKAADAVWMLEPGYAADCAPYLDPHTVGQLADVAPPEPIVQITNEVLRRGDYVTAGPFLAYATPTLIRAIEAGVADDEGLIRSAAYAYSGENLSGVMRQLLHGRSHRIPQMVATVLAGSAELQLAALSVFARCDSDVVGAVGELMFEFGSTAAITELIGTVIAAGAIPELLRFVGNLRPSALDSLAANPIIGDHTGMSALVGALEGADEPALWRGLLCWIERTDFEVQRRIARQITELTDPTLLAVPGAATEARIWPALLRILSEADLDTQAQIGEVWALLTPSVRADLQRRVKDLRLDTRLATLTVTLDIYA